MGEFGPLTVAELQLLTASANMASDQVMGIVFQQQLEGQRFATTALSEAKAPLTDFKVAYEVASDWAIPLANLPQ